MSDISVRMTLKDEVSSKLDKIKSSATECKREACQGISCKKMKGR